MISVSVNQEYWNAFGPDQFGGNFLFMRDRLGENGTFDELSAELGVETLRYPGGAITERLFDINDPNRVIGYDDAEDEMEELVPLSEFLAFSGKAGHSVTIVLPTRNFLSERTDVNGDRYPDFDHGELTKFIQDVATGVHGVAEIKAFEIGNEYWDGGQMSSVEYGRLASEMSVVVDEALASIEGEFPQAQDIEIVVQSATNFNHAKLDDQYSDLETPQEMLQQLAQDYEVELGERFLNGSGDVNWAAVNDELLRNEFSDTEFASIDGVVAHIYSRGPELPVHRDFSLKKIQRGWEERDPDLKKYVTEWNQKSTDSLDEENDYGLKQAHEILNIMEEFSEHDVDTAHVWPLLQNTRNTLSHGFEHEELTPAGEMFRLMEEALPGTRPLDLFGSESDQNELSLEQVDLHAFASPEKLVLFVASKTDEVSSTILDLNGLLTSGDEISVSCLGVEDGDNPGSRHADAFLDTPSESEVETEIYVEGHLRADLDGFEIMRVVIDRPQWSPAMEEYWARLDDAPDDSDDPIIPDVDEDDAPDPTEESEEDGDDGGFGALLGALAIVPILMLML
ncbi:hypothetical protein [Leisingera sp. ANG-S5]|uniref:hypothetical protein n=1 Tax=Leisingera sp. ANG-S5 TaxID=1577901 RepID=UPI0006913D41|nr:hypothetical protein [Leisingera sp. ANG-S5]